MQTPDVEIRVAQNSDAPALAGLIVAFRDHLGAARPTADELSSYLPGMLGDASVEFCVCVAADDSALGYSQCRFFPSVWAAGPEAHLEDLFVVSTARRRGIGGDLGGAVDDGEIVDTDRRRDGRRGKHLQHRRQGEVGVRHPNEGPARPRLDLQIMGRCRRPCRQSDVPGANAVDQGLAAARGSCSRCAR